MLYCKRNEGKTSDETNKLFSAVQTAIKIPLRRYEIYGYL